MFGSTRLAPTSTGIMIRRLQIMLPLWYLWSKFNPWVNEYNEEKKKLIKYCHFVHGKRIFNENTILPRWWTESYVNHLVRKRYKNRIKGKDSAFNVEFVNYEVGTDFIEKPVEDDDDDDDDDDDEDED